MTKVERIVRGGQLKNWAVLCSIMVLVLFISTQVKADPLQMEKWNYQSHQTFKGQAFFKDTNLWVYSHSFAEAFGMPQTGVDARLQGIEAAAFRIEPGRTTCGMAGKEENCHQDQRCMLDIYVDEAKNPLPWATDQQADWEDDYTSLEMVMMSVPNDQSSSFIPIGVIPNEVVGGIVHPFADPDSHREANFFHNANNPKHVGDARNGGDFGNSSYVFGYRRNAVRGLTMISLYHTCFARNEEKKEVSYRLESRRAIASPTLVRFFEFTLPQRFLGQVDEITDKQRKSNAGAYKKLLNRE